MIKKLTKTQHGFLLALSDDWVSMDDDWKATPTFHKLLDAEYVDWRQQRRGYCDVSIGPGAHGGWYWQIRRTMAGRRALGLEETAV